MRIRHYLLLFIGAALVSCSTLTGAASLITCHYDVENVANPRIGGISLNNVTNIETLSVSQLAQFSLGMLSGNLPLAATVNVGVTNPNQTAADLAGLDWQLFFNGAKMLDGSTAQAVHVAPNGGRSSIPLVVQVNLMDLFKKDSKNEIFKFANGLLNLGESTSELNLKVRPAFNIGGQIVKGGYFNVGKQF